VRVRRNSLDTLGEIGLTLLFLLWPLIEALDELGQSQEIAHPKGGTTGCKDDEGIWGNKTGPGRWKRSDTLRSLVKRDAIFSPIVTVVEDLKLFSIQGMERMRDRENSFR
jgi:hypothetical protein